MALEKIEVIDKIEVLENGCVQVRTKTTIMKTANRSVPLSTATLSHLAMTTAQKMPVCRPSVLPLTLLTL